MFKTFLILAVHLGIVVTKIIPIILMSLSLFQRHWSLRFLKIKIIIKKCNKKSKHNNNNLLKITLYLTRANDNSTI